MPKRVLVDETNESNIAPQRSKLRRRWWSTSGAFLAIAAFAWIGYLMEISPDDRRPAYSGYFNALIAPAGLSPLVGAVVLETVGGPSLLSAILQILVVRRLRCVEPGPKRA